jgi:hypothetical protein
MKTFVMILALLALSAAVPAFAAENAMPPAPASLTAPSPACSSPAAASAVSNAQNNELPSWLTEKPVLWSPETESLLQVSSGCAAYCRECGGCCAILGPNSCACC